MSENTGAQTRPKNEYEGEQENPRPKDKKERIRKGVPFDSMSNEGLSAASSLSRNKNGKREKAIRAKSCQAF